MRKSERVLISNSPMTKMKQLISHSTILLYRLSTIRWFVFIVSNKWTQWQLAGFHLFVIRIFLVGEGFVVVFVDLFWGGKWKNGRARGILQAFQTENKKIRIHSLWRELDWAIILRDNGFLKSLFHFNCFAITRLWAKRRKKRNENG